MYNYEIRVVPKKDCEGNIYWTAFYPAIEGCVGGGESLEEAVADAKENLEIFLEYLKDEKLILPEEYAENEYNGKIALRLAKSTHKKVSEMAEREGISINTFLISAVENYLGLKQCSNVIERRIDELQELTTKTNILEAINLEYNKAMATKILFSQEIKLR